MCDRELLIERLSVSVCTTGSVCNSAIASSIWAHLVYLALFVFVDNFIVPRGLDIQSSIRPSNEQAYIVVQACVHFVIGHLWNLCVTMGMNTVLY